MSRRVRDDTLGLMVNFKSITAEALAVAGLGIMLQIVGGVADYPVIPPGLVILFVAAALVWFLRRRWAPAIGIVVSIFMIVGLFAAGQASRLIEVEEAVDTIGLWVQIVAVAVAMTSGVLALVRPATSS